MGHSNESRTTEYTDKHGYKLSYAPVHPRASIRGWIASHILIAEKVLGKLLPINAEVHHVDENKANNQNNNLVICENHAYHGLLHSRLNIVKAGGDPDRHKKCSTCQQVKLHLQFGIRSRSPDGLRENCKDCISIANAKRIR